MVSALTMLGCHESESRNRSYGEISDRIRRYGVAKYVKRDQKELFGRMVFNILVTNDDDHLRNHAFLWDGEHRKWRLSPLYDVMPRALVSFERVLHLGVGPEGRRATLDNALAGSARFGLTSREARDVVDRIWGVVGKWKDYFEGFGVPDTEIRQIEAAFRNIDDVLTAGDPSAPEY
jgi:serine/threonine-protein kinase HipA